MPKESVRGSEMIEADRDGRVVVGTVDVCWSRNDDTVQVVSKAVFRADGSRVSDSKTVDVTDGLYVNLDRAGINALIRNLRRARDQAFGRDE